MTLLAKVTHSFRFTALGLFLFIVVIAIYLITVERFEEDEAFSNNVITLIRPDPPSGLHLDESSAVHNIVPKIPDIETSRMNTSIRNIPNINISVRAQETQSHYTQPNINNDTRIIPTSWQQLNDQQFCSVHASSPQQRLLEHIYKLQFTRNCNDPSTQFLIYDIYLEKTRGLGASLFGWLNRFMTVALQTNRTLLLDGLFDWTADVSYCNGTNAMECYFVPLSNCDPIHILSQVNKSDPLHYHEGANPKSCVFGENDRYNNLSACPQRVIYISGKRPRRPILKRAMNYFAETHFNMRVLEFETILIAFLLRPQPHVRRIIYDKVSKSIDKSLNGQTDSLVASEYISLPIRASDKCKNIGGITHKHYTHKAEIKCFTPFEYMLLMNVMRHYANTQLKGVILTSEDNAFVQEVVDMMRYNNHSNVKHWNVILNTEDYSVGEGTTTYKKTKRIFNQSLDAKVGTSLETDHIISALSSLVLQIHLETEYMLWLYDSSWTELMWDLLAILNCNVHKEKHVPDHNKCVTLYASGYIHQMEHNTVHMSHEIWKKLQRENITQQQFYDTFGLWYDTKNFCHIEGTKKRVAK